MDDRYVSSHPSLTTLCLVSAAWAFSFGLSIPLSALWLQQAGYDHSTVGLNTSCYYLGVAIASPFLPRIMRHNQRLVVLAGMVLDGLSVALFPLVNQLEYWLFLRFLGGVGTAMALIPMETCVNRYAPPNKRALHFGIYALCVASGIGLGPVVGLPLFSWAPLPTFVLGGSVALLAALGLLSMPVSGEEEESTHSARFPWKEQMLPLGTAWVQGFLEGGMFTFLTVYLLSLGYSERGTSPMLGVMFLGVVLVQLPCACLADRLGRMAILLTCHIVVLLGLILFPFLHGAGELGLVLFCVGACCAALYPLGLALLGERLPPGSLATANAWYLASNCLGSLSGPWLLGLAIDQFGLTALFVLGSLCQGIILILGISLLRWRGSGHPAFEAKQPAERSAA